MGRITREKEGTKIRMWKITSARREDKDKNAENY